MYKPENFLHLISIVLGGTLFSQQQNEDLIKLAVNTEGIVFSARTAGKTYDHVILGNFVNNKWHTVYLQYRLGNLTIDVDGETQVNIFMEKKNYWNKKY